MDLAQRLRTPLLALFLIGLSASPSAAADVHPARDRLVDAMLRMGQAILRLDFVDIETVDTALATAELALELRPDDPDLHRYLARLAAFRELDDRRAEAIEAVARLDPGDEAARLMHLAHRIDALPTAEARAREYRRILSDPAAIGSAVASRLALDAALMEWRRGDEAAFATWLAESASLDPANAAAIAIAAGFFRLHLSDPVEEAELLLHLLMADPTQPATASILARLLADHGAMRGAARMFGFLASSYRASNMLIPTDLVADQAIVGWALGERQDVLRMLRDVRRRFDQEVRIDAAARLGYVPTPEERGRMQASLGGTLETVEAAFLHQMGDAGAPVALQRALQLLARERAERAGLDLSAEPSRALEMVESAEERLAVAAAIAEEAWVALWLGGDPSLVVTLLDEAAGFAPLDPEAAERFQGWLALREGRSAEALALLEPIAEADALAQLGVAKALEASGRVREAARAHLDVARRSPGSLVGVWSQGELQRLLGTRVPISETARRLESLMQTLPSIYDRLPEAPSRLVEVRIVLPARTIAIGQPVDFEIEVRNYGPIPLAIDRSGPIRPQVVVEVESTFGRRGLRNEGLPSIVVELDRHLSVPARGAIRVPVRLGQHPAGIAAEQSLATGGFLRLTATLNPQAVSVKADAPGGRQPALRPGPLGGTYVTPTIRLEGIELTRQKTEDLVSEAAAEPDVDRRTLLVALLFQVLTALAASDEELMPASELETMSSRLFSLFRGLEDEGQAWVLAVLRNDRLPRRLREIVMTTDNRLLKVMFMLAHVGDIRDPFLTASIDGDDPVMQRLGQLFAENYRRTEERMRERDRQEGLLPGRR